MNATAASSIASTMCCPFAAPVARAYSAAVIACAAVYDVTLSHSNVRNSDGVPVTGSDCTDARPDAAWMTLSYTRRWLDGPSGP